MCWLFRIIIVIPFVDCSNLKLSLVHGESVERFVTDRLDEYTPTKNLKNLQYLYVGPRRSGERSYCLLWWGGGGWGVPETSDGVFPRSFATDGAACNLQCSIAWIVLSFFLFAWFFMQCEVGSYVFSVRSDIALTRYPSSSSVSRL